MPFLEFLELLDLILVSDHESVLSVVLVLTLDQANILPQIVGLDYTQNHCYSENMCILIIV